MPKPKSLGIIILLLVLSSQLIAFTSCSEGVDYCQYHSVNGIWHHEDTLFFDVDSAALSTQTSSTTPILIVRATEDFRYQYLRVLVEIGDERSDTVTLRLFNEKDEQQGHGLIHKELEQPLDSIAGLSDLKSLQFRICQVMQTDTVSGITQVGVKF